MNRVEVEYDGKVLGIFTSMEDAIEAVERRGLRYDDPLVWYTEMVEQGGEA